MGEPDQQAEEAVFAAALRETSEALNTISMRHYGRDLDDLMAGVDTPLGRRQFARLLGVLIKEPFAVEHPRPPSESTKAVVGLQWKDNAEIWKSGTQTWQFQFMRSLEGERRGRVLSEDEAFSALTFYMYESSLGKFLFEAFRDRICGDAKTTKAVRDALAAAGKHGVRILEPTTANITVGAASVIAVAIGSLMTPTLAATGAPVIGAIALLILQVGVDGFCRWSRQVIEEPGSAGGESAAEQ